MRKSVKITAILGLVIGLAAGNAFYSFAANALPNGNITEQNGKKYLTDSQGTKYSGWFIDANKDWFYFNESDQSMKTGWHHDNADKFTYYLDENSGKMLTGWQTINGKDYYFQPVRDMGNYHFNSEQEKWLYSLNSKVPYGALYTNTTTPDGSKVDENGAKIIETANTIQQGWRSENGKWYYILADGSKFSNGWKEINGKSYYFGSNGAMYVNATTPDGSKVDKNGAKLLTDNTSKQNINYQNYIGTFGGEGVEQIPDRPHWVGYFNIVSIKDNKIYGTFEQYYDVLYSADFSDGVPINGDTFKINMNFDDSGKFELRTGLLNYGSITCSFTVTCKLTYKDREPIIIINGTPNKNYPAPEQNTPIQGFDNKEMVKFNMKD